MNSKQKAKTNMYLGLLMYLNGTMNIWQVLAVFAGVFDTFKEKLMALQAAQTKQEELTKGYALNKRNKLIAMAEIAFKIKGSLQAYAAATGNDILFIKVNWSFSELLFGASTVKRNRCQAIFDCATAEIANLVPYSVTAADLVDLDKAIVDYNNVISSPKSVVAAREEVTKQIKELIKSIDETLKKRMDKLVSFFMVSSPEFYNVYFNERKINDPKTNFTEIVAVILNKQTGEKIEGVLMKGLGNKGTNFTEVSNYQGVADKKQIQAEIYNLEFEMPGYEKAEVKNVKLSPGEKEEFVIEMVPVVI